jgi:hypothetical protein
MGAAAEKVCLDLRTQANAFVYVVLDVESWVEVHQCALAARALWLLAAACALHVWRAGCCVYCWAVWLQQLLCPSQCPLFRVSIRLFCTYSHRVCRTVQSDQRLPCLPSLQAPTSGCFRGPSWTSMPLGSSARSTVAAAAVAATMIELATG